MKKTVEEKLEDVLNINSEIIEAEQEILAPAIISNSNMDADNDFIKAKSNIASLIEKGEAAVDGILQLAKESEQPRAYEVASTLIKTMVDANKELLDVHKQKKELDKEEYAGPAKAVQNNTVFVGSTKELQKQLLQLAKGARVEDSE
jgi:predicted house-cleaning noncanonical NTP pyrophosphatase (MazG superfamily)